VPEKRRLVAEEGTFSMKIWEQKIARGGVISVSSRNGPEITARR